MHIMMHPILSYINNQFYVTVIKNKAKIGCENWAHIHYDYIIISMASTKISEILFCRLAVESHIKYFEMKMVFLCIFHTIRMYFTPIM